MVSITCFFILDSVCKSGSVQRFLFGTLDNNYRELIANMKNNQKDDLNLIENHATILEAVLNGA